MAPWRQQRPWRQNRRVAVFCKRHLLRLLLMQNGMMKLEGGGASSEVQVSVQSGHFLNSLGQSVSFPRNSFGSMRVWLNPVEYFKTLINLKCSEPYLGHFYRLQTLTLAPASLLMPSIKLYTGSIKKIEVSQQTLISYLFSLTWSGSFTCCLQNVLNVQSFP